MATKGDFFELGDASTRTRSYAWAMGFGLLDTPMPFFHPNELAREIQFQKVNPFPPGLRIEDPDPGRKATKWPDFLGHGGGNPPQFISDIVVEDLRANGVPIMRLTEMPIAAVDAAGLQSVRRPRYFVMEVAPGIEVDFAASGIPTDASGKAILQPLPKPWPPVLRLRKSSWTGADLFSYANYGGALTLVCTERIVKLARKQRWSNCRFEPMWSV